MREIWRSLKLSRSKVERVPRMQTKEKRAKEGEKNRMLHGAGELKKKNGQGGSGGKKVAYMQKIETTEAIPEKLRKDYTFEKRGLGPSEGTVKENGRSRAKKHLRRPSNPG